MPDFVTALHSSFYGTELLVYEDVENYIEELCYEFTGRVAWLPDEYYTPKVKSYEKSVWMYLNPEYPVELSYTFFIDAFDSIGYELAGNFYLTV